MLSQKQLAFKNNFLSPLKQRLYFLKNLPMGLLSGIKLIYLDEEKSVTVVPYRWVNKNPFNSMYFAVQSMAAELSTAALVTLALKSTDANVALIIVEIKADFVKKAQSKITFNCMEYEKICDVITLLKKVEDTATVTVKTTGRNITGDEVAVFYFTWSFKRKT
ncbi:hypothetical protein MNBD_GAMMA06-1844 [hydrothermal vent metagenome]|uniref:Thioesterase n=1 Tax=hydrothermal vent metagenome TaxID=652676 RepID=A0A3B0WFS7_9ZZZZ